MKRRDMILQLQASADDTRLKILDLVSQGTPSATEIVAHLGMSQPRVAHHLKILVTAGLLNARREGRFMRYTLPTTGFESSLVRLILMGPGHVATGVPEPAQPRARESGSLPVSSPPNPQPSRPAEEADSPDEQPTASKEMEDFLL